MRGYHDTDRNVNEIIFRQIEFNKHYDIAFVTPQISDTATTLQYKITDKAGKPVDDATIKAIITRPNKHEFDVELMHKSVENGIYTFETVTLPKQGRWNIMAKINIGEHERYFNLKADTRYPQTYEY